jgi:hypothetical protein
VVVVVVVVVVQRALTPTRTSRNQVSLPPLTFKFRSLSLSPLAVGGRWTLLQASEPDPARPGARTAATRRGGSPGARARWAFLPGRGERGGG